jgi:high-affinity iron transporter
MSVLAIVIGIAVLREGSEIVLMLGGLWSTGSTAALIGGGILGLIGGILVGALMYAGFLALPIGRVFSLTNSILVLIAAGMAAHGANFLAQAGLLSSLGGRAWDTSRILSDQSAMGQFLSALVGYIARPNGIEVLFYGMTVAVVLSLMMRVRRRTLRAGTR